MALAGVGGLHRISDFGSRVEGVGFRVQCSGVGAWGVGGV